MSDVTEIHIVCNRTGSNRQPLNVEDVTVSHFVSGYWLIAEEHLRPGVLFALHKSKREYSFLQGAIEDVEKVKGNRFQVFVRRSMTPVPWVGAGAGERGYKHGGSSLPSIRAADIFVPPDISAKELRRTVSKLAQLREGQPAFRQKLLAAYGRRCAVTGCAIGELLEAAHILPYHGKLSNHVQNGLLLRADIHALFDRQLFEFCPTEKGVRIDTSNRLKDSEYEHFNKEELRLPLREDHRPSRAALNKRMERMPKF